IMTIRNIDITPVQPIAVQSSRTTAATTDFTQLLQTALNRVETSGKEASRGVEQLLGGETQDLHSVAIANQKASLEFEMLLQVRNKIVNAYQEVMRMQL
ncbi:MAG TPA: flagellar hook-basal body complex protein FliE, partial [Bryobacteraceae bacterium]|nr:flagellar hook-basal body complex protein FliE [Bryobacteraceae bacterium]